MTVSEKCLDTEIFVVRIFLYSVQIKENTDQKKLRILTLFTWCEFLINLLEIYVHSNICCVKIVLPEKITPAKGPNSLTYPPFSDNCNITSYINSYLKI